MVYDTPPPWIVSLSDILKFFRIGWLPPTTLQIKLETLPIYIINIHKQFILYKLTNDKNINELKNWKDCSWGKLTDDCEVLYKLLLFLTPSIPPNKD